MDPQTPTTPVPAPPRRRGCWGCLFQSGLGCGAFLFGSVVAAVLFAPSLLVGPIGELLERGLDARLAGSVRVDELDLSWKRGQHAVIELDDPDGTRVGRFEVRVPSLLSLLRMEEDDWRVRVWATEARVVVAEDGTNNLAAALADPQGETSWWDLGRRLFGAEEGYSTPFGFHVELNGDEVVIEGLQDGRLVVLRELSAQLQRVPQGQDSWLVKAAVEEGARVDDLAAAGDFHASLTYTSPEPNAERASPWASAPELSGRLDWNDLSAATVARLVDLPLEELFGADFEGHLTVEGEADAGFGVDLAVDGEALTFTGTWRDGQLIGVGEELNGALQVPVDWFEAGLGGHVPTGTELRAADGTWGLTGRQVRLPIGPPGQPWPARRDLLAGLRGLFELRAPGDVELVDVQRGTPLASLSGTQLNLALTESEDLVLGLKTASAGDRSVTGMLYGRGDLARTLAEGARNVSLNTVGVGPLVLDHLRGDGIVSGLFDPQTTELDLELGDEVWLTLRDVARGGHLRGRLEDGMLVGDPEGQATLPLDLTRQPVRDLVAVMVPWLEELQAAPGGEGQRLHLRGFRLPLLGTLRESEGVLHLDLGQVRYRLTPGFYDILHPESRGQEPPLIEVWMPRIRMRLDGLQILTYDELTLIPDEDGEEIDVDSGSLDLSELRNGDLDLDCELPLRMWGSNVLPGAEDTLVPVNLNGKWHEPSKQIDAEVFQQVSRMIEAFGGSDDG